MNLPKRGISCVYFICDARNDRLKVGTTTDLYSRLRLLRKQYHPDLQVIGWKPGGLRLERLVHSCYAAIRLEGEWFSLTQELLTLARAEDWPADILGATLGGGAADSIEAVADLRPLDASVPTALENGVHDSNEPLIASMRSAIGFMLLHEGSVAGGVTTALNRVAECLGIDEKSLHAIWYRPRDYLPAHIYVQFHIGFSDYLRSLRGRASALIADIDSAMPGWDAYARLLTPPGAGVARALADLAAKTANEREG